MINYITIVGLAARKKTIDCLLLPYLMNSHCAALECATGFSSKGGRALPQTGHENTFPSEKKLPHLIFHANGGGTALLQHFSYS